MQVCQVRLLAFVALLTSFLVLDGNKVPGQSRKSGVAGPIGVPPEELHLDTFYRKHLDFQGLPIVSSHLVPDAALIETREIVANMLLKRPEMLDKLKQNKVRVAIMAESEKTTDIPEHSDLAPKSNWDKRARGLGATRARPASTCAEENVLRYPNDPYRGESILVHEFAHTLHLLAIVEIDKEFDSRLKAAYSSAVQRGLWKETYAATNHKEYWAEGVQSWFNANKEVNRPDGIHNQINTHFEVLRYDPLLAQLIGEWFVPPPRR